MDELEQLSIEMRKSHQETKSWRKTGAEFGVDPATARLIANGYRPGNRMRARLSLPPTVPVPVCGVCGVAHLYDCRTQEVKPKTNGRPKRRKRQPFRPCLPQVTDAQRAAILAMTPDERLEKLLK